MSDTLLSKARRISAIVQNCSFNGSVIQSILDEYKRNTNANIVLVDIKGKVMQESLVYDDSILSRKIVDQCPCIEAQLNEQFNNVTQIKENLSLNELYIKKHSPEELRKYKAVIIPANVLSERFGTMMIYRKGEKFSDDELILLEYINSALGLIMAHSKLEKTTEKNRKLAIIKSAIATLSYSELEAIIHIFEELKGNEGLIVASKIADKVGITRSVIVNALRKLESAGIIESRSLGMKGTYIKVLNEYLSLEINKLDNS